MLTELRLSRLQNFVFRRRPRRLRHGGIEVILPALAALLSNAPGHARGNVGPSRHAVFEAAEDGLVLRGGPCALDEAGAEDLGPTVGEEGGTEEGVGGVGGGRGRIGGLRGNFGGERVHQASHLVNNAVL